MNAKQLAAKLEELEPIVSDIADIEADGTPLLASAASMLRKQECEIEQLRRMGNLLCGLGLARKRTERTGNSDDEPALYAEIERLSDNVAENMYRPQRANEVAVLIRERVLKAL